MRYRRVLFLAASLIAACNPSGREAVPSPQSGSGSAAGTGSLGAASAAGRGNSTATAANALDIVVILALDAPSDELLKTTRAAVEQLLSGVAQIHDVHVAVIAGKKDRAGGSPFAAPGGLAASAFKPVDFDLAPKDGLLGAVVAGCDAKASSFPDPHLAANDPLVCGKRLLELAGNTKEVLTHSWLWALDPVKGALNSFFRTGAKRLYVIIANGDAEFLDAASFSTLIGAQSSAALGIVAAVPTGGGTSCSTTSTAAQKYLALAGAVGGQQLDLCATSAGQIAAAVTTQAEKLAR